MAPAGFTRLMVAFSVGALLLGACTGGRSQARTTAPPRFSLRTDPSTLTMAPDGSATSIADVEYLGGFTTTDAGLWVRGLPAGVTGSFAPEPLTHEGKALLLLKGDGSLSSGRYPIVLGATAAGASSEVPVTLVVTTKPDFAISVSPVTQDAAINGVAVYRVVLRPMNEFHAAMGWAVSGLPAGVRSSFAPAGHDRATLTVHVRRAAAAGRYDLKITASGDGVTHNVPATLLVGAATSAWTVSSVGTTGTGNNSIRVGNGRNDGVNRLYVGTVGTGRVMELSWNGASWDSPVDIGGSPTGKEIHNLTVGTGRNDGVSRVYACSLEGSLYELTYTGSGWAQQTVGSPSGSCTHVTVGHGRNDGIDRLYATRGTTVWEYTRIATGWRAVQVGHVSSGLVHGIFIGRGRGGSTRHLYIASTAHGTFEATFANSVWTMTSMGDSGDVRNATVGAGRNDGRNRVYAGAANGQMREFTWGSGGWTFRSIGSISGVMVHAYVVNGRNDGRLRVYGAGGDGNAYEFTWSASLGHWTKVNLGGGSSYMYGFHYGLRPGDTRMHLYGTAFDGNVYEYTWG